MEISEFQSIEVEPAEAGHVAVPGSAIQKQQAAESLIGERSTPDLVISERALPKSSKKSWLFLIALLILLPVIFLFRYGDVLLPLYSGEVAVSVPALENGQLEQQLDMARKISLVLIEEPYKLGELVTFYRNILVENPDQPEALSGLQQLPMQCLFLVSFYMASGQADIARQIVEDSLLYFPGLADDPLWQQLMNNIPGPAVDVAITDEMADEVIEEQNLEVVAVPETESKGVIAASTSLSGAEGGSSAAEDLPLPEPAEPISTESMSTEPMSEAPTIASVDLALAAGALRSAEQDTIDRLLQEATDFSQKGIQFTQQENAVTRYQDVLALQPTQADATAGLQALIDTRIAYVKRLEAEKDLDTARLMLEPALRRFPVNPQLLALSRLIDTHGGFISSLEVAFLPASAMDPALVSVGGQTLLLSFSYKYFPSTTTVVNAQLFNLPYLDTIAGVPIILQDPRGSKSVQMNTLTRKIEDGRYQLVLSSGDKQLIKYEFTVKNNTISYNAEL
jgi:hypothetical protein